MQISLIILTKDRKTMVLKVLDSIKKQTVQPAEILVIDGSSEPIVLPKYLQRTLRIRLLLDNRKSIPYARNVGIRNAKYPILFFLDDDCIPDIHALENIKNHFRNHKNSQAVVGLIKNCTPDNISACVQQAYYDRWLLDGKIHKEEQLLPDGTFMDFEVLAIKRSCIRKYFFNEDLPFGRDEDIELGARLFKKEKYVYFSRKIFANHIPSQTIFSLFKRNFINGYCNYYLSSHFGIIFSSKTHIQSFGTWVFSTMNSLPGNIFRKSYIACILVLYPFVSKLGKYYCKVHYGY